MKSSTPAILTLSALTLFTTSLSHAGTVSFVDLAATPDNFTEFQSDTGDFGVNVSGYGTAATLTDMELVPGQGLGVAFDGSDGFFDPGETMFFWFDRTINPNEQILVRLAPESGPVTNLAEINIIPNEPGATPQFIGRALPGFDFDQNSLTLDISSGLAGEAIGAFTLRYAEPVISQPTSQSFVVESISVVAVPEPSALAGCLFAAGALAFRRKRRPHYNPPRDDKSRSR